MNDEQSPAKRQKNTAQKPKKVHEKEMGRAQNFAEENEVEEAKPKVEEHPNDQHIKDFNPGRAKAYTDECTAFVSNLNLRASRDSLTLMREIAFYSFSMLYGQIQRDNFDGFNFF